MRYEITVKDIKNIVSPVVIGSFIIEAQDRSEAMDKAHSRADKEFFDTKKLVELRKI